MKRIRTLTLAFSAALLLAAAVGSPASAFSMIQLTGHYGEFGTKSNTADDSSRPGAKCGYSAPDQNGVAHLVWVKVFPWLALAYDRTSANDHQQIKFQVTLQRSKNGGATWKSVGSASQTRTGSDMQSASFGSLTVKASGKPNQLFRAIVTLTWLHNGQADGLARARMEYYGVKWTVGDPAYVFTDACDGASD
jgi:Tfp pilus assembly protein PilX